MEKQWQQTNRGNFILKHDDFYISYRDPSRLPNEIGIDLMELIFGDAADLKEEETALVIIDNDDRFYLVLRGNFSQEYEEAFPELDKCLEVYREHELEFRSPWSSDEDLEVLFNYIIDKLKQ